MTPALKRVRDWRARLSDVIEGRRRVPFSEEKNCALFMADCLEAMTVVDLAAKYRGKFSTIAEGFELLRRDGFDSLGDYCAAHLEEIHPSHAVAGDIAIINCEQGEAGGVFNGERVTVLSTQGLGTVLRSEVVRAFRVPL